MLLPQCGICLDLVMAQQPPSARKFGLLACEHAFCLRCIRSWRGTGENDATTETVSVRPVEPFCQVSLCAGLQRWSLVCSTAATRWLTLSISFQTASDRKRMDSTACVWAALMQSCDCDCLPCILLLT
jgi:Zinc finger, C3HC4 type (RING finger)